MAGRMQRGKVAILLVSNSSFLLFSKFFKYKIFRLFSDRGVLLMACEECKSQGEREGSLFGAWPFTGESGSVFALLQLFLG